jgi:prophage regulatory protein
MSDNIIRLPDVIKKCGLSKSTIYLMISKREFPESISLGERAVGWIESEIDQWLEDKIAVSRKS